MIKRIHIYDLDGVLVDTAHRYRNNPDGTIDLDYWFMKRTRKNIALDRLLPLAKQYRQDNLNDETYVIVCTSRVWHDDDVDFIVNRLGAPDKLIMRPKNNYQADDILKMQALKNLFQLKQFRDIPKKFWDDNQRNINAVTLLGVRCFHVKSNQGL